MKHKVAVKHPGKPLEIVEIESQYRTDVKSIIAQDDDTILQFVIMEQTGDRVFCFACDEEGLMKKLPLNFEMLTRSGNTSFLSQVVGTVVFLVYKLEDTCNQEIYDFEIGDITEKDIALAEHLLKKETQQRAKKLARMDPNIRTKPEFVFRPIDNLDEFLNMGQSSLHGIPSYFIPLEIFGNFSPQKEIEFFTDPAGKERFVAGVRVESGGEVVFYCSSKVTAKNFEIRHGLLKEALTAKLLEKYIEKYFAAMHKMGLLPFLYVTKQTQQKYFSKK